jgi:hypothetical protein
MEDAPPIEHVTRLSHGGLRRRVHELSIGRHDYKDRAGPIREQDDGFKKPAPVESDEIGDEP